MILSMKEDLDGQVLSANRPELCSGMLAPEDSRVASLLILSRHHLWRLAIQAKYEVQVVPE